MRYKETVLNIIDDMGELLTASKLSMEKHTISPEILYKNLIRLQEHLEQVVTLIKREPDEK